MQRSHTAQTTRGGSPSQAGRRACGRHACAAAWRGAAAHLARSLRRVHYADCGVCELVCPQPRFPVANVRRRRRQLRAGGHRERAGQRQRAWQQRSAYAPQLFLTALPGASWRPQRRAQAPGAARTLCNMISYGCPACRRGARAVSGGRTARTPGTKAANAQAATQRRPPRSPPRWRRAPARAALGAGPPAGSAGLVRCAAPKACQTPKQKACRAAGAARAPSAGDELGRQQAAALLVAEDVADASLPKAIH